MRRIANGSQAAALPAAATPTGTPGYFTDGDPAAGTPGTIVDNDWLNLVQEALIGDSQFVRVAANANASRPSWATRARVRMWGAGGGAGSSAGSNSAGAGGGGGGYLEILVSGLDGVATVACGIGAGGAAGSGTNAGGAGTATSFGAYATCSPGLGGGFGNSAISTAPGAGGTFTVASGVQVIDSYNGLSGEQGYPSGTGIRGAAGGGSFGSAYVSPPTSDASTPKIGFGGAFAGQGGGAGVDGGTGAAGSNGLILIEWLP